MFCLFSIGWLVELVGWWERVRRCWAEGYVKISKMLDWCSLVDSAATLLS